MNSKTQCTNPLKGFTITDIALNHDMETAIMFEELITCRPVYLTGSRFFTPQTIGKNTDWDFFMARFEDLDDILKKYGFEKQNLREYNDLLISDVYSRTTPLNRKIDIQVISNYNIGLKVKAQDFLYGWIQTHPDWWVSMDKDSRSIVWNLAISALFKKEEQ